MSPKKLELSVWPLTRIVPYEKNTKKHPAGQVDSIAASIQDYGWNDPIGIDENGVILEGHGRYLAAQKLGLTEVPVLIVYGLGSDKEKALYRTAHNRLTLSTGFDVRVLAEELSALQEFENIKIESLGFNKKDLDAIMRGLNTGQDELAPSVFAYTLVFSNETQHAAWRGFMAKVRATSDKALDPAQAILSYAKSKGAI